MELSFIGSFVVVDVFVCTFRTVYWLASFVPLVRLSCVLHGLYVRYCVPQSIWRLTKTQYLNRSHFVGWLLCTYIVSLCFSFSWFAVKIPSNFEFCRHIYNILAAFSLELPGGLDEHY